MIIKSFICAVYSALLIAATSAQAIPMLETDSGGNITGVSNLTVGGVAYNAAFSGGAYPIYVFGQPYVIPLYSRAFADDATAALAAYLGSALIGPIDPYIFLGCDSLEGYPFQRNDCHLSTVYQFGYDFYTGCPPYMWSPECSYLPVDGSTVDIDESGVYGTTAFYETDDTDDYNEVGDVAWVKWSVTEPPVSILMASGLIVFGVTRRKRRA